MWTVPAGRFAGMVSTIHEAAVDLFRHRPSFAAELLNERLGFRTPDYQQAILRSGDLTEVTPTEYRADAAVVLTDAGKDILAVVIEVQLSRDPRKRLTWPVYVTTPRARMNCPTVLLVLCMDTAIATWCAKPIDVGHPGLVLTPLVVTPDLIPVVAEIDPAQPAPELAVLSAMAHGGHRDYREVMESLVRSLNTIDSERAISYSKVVLATAPAVAKKFLEGLLTSVEFEYRSELTDSWVAKGIALGRAQDVVAILDARDIEIPDEARARITDCTDLDQLNTWVRQAATAEKVNDLLD
jgi:hypothetical protein